MMKKYDIAVIGGGPGGYVAAIRAAKLGKHVALVEERDLGGTCLNRGCIPTKTLLHSSDLYRELGEAKKIGISVSDYEFQYKKMAKRKEKVVKTLRSGVSNLLSGNHVELLVGRAVMTGVHTFRVGEEEIEADQMILATGSKPASIPIPGIDHPAVQNSDEVLELTECPESVIIIGGGVIGVEFATLFSDLGKAVTIVEMMPTILYGQDPDICRTMTDILTGRGVSVHTGAKVLEIADGTICRYEEEGEQKEAEAALIIVAAGRKPNSDNMGLEEIGIAMERGFIQVDDEMRTSVPNIYAIGDVTGKIQLAHVASAQGIVAAVNAAQGLHTDMDYSAVPSCIYTSPEIASVGMTMQQAEEAGYKVRCGRFNVSGNGRSLAVNNMDGFAKIVADADTDKILGVSVMAPYATEMIGEACTAIRYGLTAEQLANVIHAHPTVSEILMEAAEDVHGLATHKL
jgi:dihydrolipoamide dehydrogenase